MTEDDPVTAMTRRYITAQEAADQAKSDLFDVCAQRVRDRLDTPDTLATRTPFTAVTIRKALRERGVEALPRGPKKPFPSTSELLQAGVEEYNRKMLNPPRSTDG